MRYLTKSELRDLFTLGNWRCARACARSLCGASHVRGRGSASELKARFDAIVGVPTLEDASLAAHVQSLEGGALSASCVGVSHHDLIFAQQGTKDVASAEVMEEMARSMTMKRAPARPPLLPPRPRTLPPPPFGDAAGPGRARPPPGNTAAAATAVEEVVDGGDEDGDARVVDLVGDAARRRSSAVASRRSSCPHASPGGDGDGDGDGDGGDHAAGPSDGDDASVDDEGVAEFRALDPEWFDAAAAAAAVQETDGRGAGADAVASPPSRPGAVASPPSRSGAVASPPSRPGAVASPPSCPGAAAAVGEATPSGSCDTPIIQCVGVPVTPPSTAREVRAPIAVGALPATAAAAEEVTDEAGATTADSERELYQWAVAAGKEAARSGHHAEALQYLLDALDIDSSDLGMQALARDVGRRAFPDVA